MLYIIHSHEQLPPGTLLRRTDEHNHIYDEGTKKFTATVNDTACECYQLTYREYIMLSSVRRENRLNLMREPYFTFIRDAKRGAKVCSTKDISVGGLLTDTDIDDDGRMTVPLRHTSASTRCHWLELRSSSNCSSDQDCALRPLFLLLPLQTAASQSLPTPSMSDVSPEPALKPFVGEKCFVNESEPTLEELIIIDWMLAADGKLKFILDNGWVCDYEDVTVLSGNNLIKREEVLDSVEHFLMQQGLERSFAAPRQERHSSNERMKPEEGTWVLQEPHRTHSRFGDLRLGALVDVLAVDGVNLVVRNGILRWIGTLDDVFRAVVDHETGPGHEGGCVDGVVVMGKCLWSSSSPRCFHWVPADLIKCRSEVPSRPPCVETRQLDSTSGLGSSVWFRDASGDAMSGRVLWMGCIEGRECVLLQTPMPVQFKQLYVQFPVDPRSFYPCHGPGTEHGDLIFMPRIALLDSCELQETSVQESVEGLDNRLLEMHQGETLACDFMNPQFVRRFEGQRGIQGKQKSSYIDATLFSMFAFNNSYDEMLSQTQNEPSAIQLLREAIVNPLRKSCFVSHDNVMAFLEVFEMYGQTQSTEAPEKFMQILFEKVIKVPPFLTYKSGHTSHMLKLLFQMNPVLSVEKMLQLTFRFMGYGRWTSMPQNLIMLIPRNDQEFSNFVALKHNLSLNVASYLTAESRGQCNVKSLCHKPGSFSCSRCFMLLCKFHSIERGQTRLCPQCNSPLNCPYSLELYSVLCIERSHFVAFLRVPPSSHGQSGLWYFFDSMSDDRRPDMNVPLVKRLESDMDDWLNRFERCSDMHHASPYQRCLSTNAYILFYRDPRSALLHSFSTN